MESSEQGHSHYWPGEGLIPITPQAARYGYVFPVYVTDTVWKDSITWTPRSKVDTNADKRIYDLLASCYEGMGKALATEPDRVYYKFKHWFWPRLNKRATKPVKAVFGARLLLDPETEEPWLLIFNPDHDDGSVLKKGEPNDTATKHRGHESPNDRSGPESTPVVD